MTPATPRSLRAHTAQLPVPSGFEQSRGSHMIVKRLRASIPVRTALWLRCQTKLPSEHSSVQVLYIRLLVPHLQACNALNMLTRTDSHGGQIRCGSFPKPGRHTRSFVHVSQYTPPHILQ
eukprot:TRINITY_DN2577_c0_g1_i3.p1 TRINITY_DN2577_c0_g1~~TRINITY_DN2577_c0_g1_i3.p1  ORF type:complete len:120 (+),score=3.56 TRINITY_DN2577_c0_g1_i3:311-670(+)